MIVAVFVLSLAASLGAGIGASFAGNLMNDKVQAFTDGGNASTSTGQVELKAVTNHGIQAHALGFGAGGIIGGFATVTLNDVENLTVAWYMIHHLRRSRAR